MNNDNNSLETNLVASFRESVPLAFLNFLKSTIELSLNPLVSSLDQIDSKLDQMVDYTNDVLLSLEKVLNEDNSQKYTRIQDLLNFKNDLARFFRITYGYVTEMNIITFLIEEQYQLEQFKKADIGSLDYNQFYEECRMFIFRNSKQEEINHLLNEVLKHIPIRITKDKFFDYIAKSIHQIQLNPSSESLDEFFALLKQQFIGTAVEGYGTFLPDIASSIHTFQSKNLLKLTENEIEEVWEEIEIISDTLSNTINILSFLYKIYNTLSILLMLENVTLPTLYNKHVAYKDFYLSTSSIINWAANPEEKELLSETLPDLLNQHMKMLESNLQKYHSNIMKQIEETDEKILSNHNLSKEIQNYQLTLYYINANLSDLFSYDKKVESPKTTDKVLDSYLQEFENFINEKLHDMPNLFRKARMQHFLGVIPAVMSENEFMDYLHTSVEMCSTPERRALILSKLGTIMDSAGFFDKHSCDCGHDHNHDHHHHHH